MCFYVAIGDGAWSLRAQSREFFEARQDAVSLFQ